MGKAVRYTTAGFIELFSGDKTLATVLMEDANGQVIEYHEEFCLAIANNIETAAKGMKMAPKAKLNDGLIDLLLIRSQKAFDLVHFFERSYKGTHVDLPFVEYRQVKRFSITPYQKPGDVKKEENPAVAEELVDIDGELKGSTPFSLTCCPQAIRFII